MSVVVVLREVSRVVVSGIGESGIVFRVVFSRNAVEPGVVPVAVPVLDVRRFPGNIKH